MFSFYAICQSREMEYTETVTGGFKSWCKDEGYQEWDSSIFVILVELLLGKAWYYLPTRIATCLMCATAPNCVCVCAHVYVHMCSFQCRLQWWAGCTCQRLCRLLSEGLGFICWCLSQHADWTHWVGNKGQNFMGFLSEFVWNLFPLLQLLAGNNQS